jgi:hypothetical protein
LVDTKRVTALSDTEWTVDGYTVRRTIDAGIKCSCSEYRGKKICPHFAAVALMLTHK